MQSQAKIPLDDLRAMAGPWECHDSQGNTYGIWITSRTEVQRTAGQHTIGTQTGNIKAYQWGPAGTNYGFLSLTGPNSLLKLEDRHLVIDRKGLDVHFDADKLVWKGIWTSCGGNSEVMLERPVSSTTTTRNPMIGDWQGIPGKNSDEFPLPLPEASSLIRIRQDRAGRLIGWIEWFNQLENDRGAQTYGDELVFSSTTQSALNFELGTIVYCSSCSVSGGFEGAYSPATKEIIGKWFYYRVGALVRATTTTYHHIP